MRKKVLFFVTILTVLILSSLQAYASEYRSEVSVGLVYGESGKVNFTVKSADMLNVYNAETGDILYTSQQGEELFIEMGSTGFASYEKFDGSGIPKISVQTLSGSTISCNGTEYRGYIYAERQSNGKLLIINYVGIDDYVSSVLGKEMSYSWPMEALKAQAVCARNFVLCRGKTHSEYGFDVCTTTHCQVYGGVKSEHPNTRQATSETSGVLATYQGKVVSLYFFATSGGHTEDVENVWGSSYGYLRGVDDSYEEPNKANKYSWTTNLTKSDIEAKLVSKGVDIGSLVEITTDKISGTGRVMALTFHGTEGKYTAKLEKCRTILGLYSQKFTISPDSTRYIVTTSGNTPSVVYAATADCTDEVSSYCAIDGNGEIRTININSTGAKNYTIDGNGYGHGVGMSQWGARGMAENGFTYDQILMHYFTDIELG